MLDLTVYKGKQFAASNLLDIAMHVKATAQGVPLCFTSWHPRGIHLSWPLSRCLQYYRCTSSKDSYVHAVYMLMLKLIVSSPGHPALEALESQLRHGTLVRVGSGRRSKKCSRLILPYHPGLTGLNRKLQSFHQSFIDNQWLEHVPMVTWKLGAPPIARRILRDMRTKFSSGR